MDYEFSTSYSENSNWRKGERVKSLFLSGGIMTILEIAKKIEQAGGRLYLVGGAVRDKLLGKNNKDEDYCVTGITKEVFINLFPETKVRGKSFSVFALENKEFAMARTESKTGLGHKKFQIETNNKITIEEDLKRRDITINAIAQDVLTGEIIDPYDGTKDLKEKIIRAVSSAFKEDPLRVYRACRFAAELEFGVEENTIKMMYSLKEELLTLSKERVFDELRKALKKKKPSIFFEVLKKANVLEVHFKEIYDLIGALQPEKYHPEGDSYNHTMLALDNSAKITTDEKIRFCALVHDLGKGQTPKELYPHHYGHEERGLEPLKKLARTLGIPEEWKKCAITAIKEHMKGGIFSQMTIQKKVAFLERVAKSRLGLEGLQIIVYSDRARLDGEEIKNKEYNFAQIGKKMIKEIDGKYIKEKYNLEPGKEFGQRLHQERIQWLKKQSL